MRAVLRGPDAFSVPDGIFGESSCYSQTIMYFADYGAYILVKANIRPRSITAVHISHQIINKLHPPAHEDGTDRGFRNV